MSTIGKSASTTAGDRLKIDVVDPAFPQSVAKLGRQGGVAELADLAQGDLMIRVGFQVVGVTGARSVSQVSGQTAAKGAAQCVGATAAKGV